FEWSVKLLRAGGLLLCDNAFFHGSVVDDADHSSGTEGVRAFNRLAATDPRVVSAVAPIRDGLVIGVRVSTLAIDLPGSGVCPSPTNTSDLARTPRTSGGV